MQTVDVAAAAAELLTRRWKSVCTDEVIHCKCVDRVNDAIHSCFALQTAVESSSSSLMSIWVLYREIISLYVGRVLCCANSSCHHRGATPKFLGGPNLRPTNDVLYKRSMA